MLFSITQFCNFDDLRFLLLFSDMNVTTVSGLAKLTLEYIIQLFPNSGPRNIFYDQHEIWKEMIDSTEVSDLSHTQIDTLTSDFIYFFAREIEVPISLLISVCTS